jgi:hypothetical protein
VLSESQQMHGSIVDAAAHRSCHDRNFPLVAMRLPWVHHVVINDGDQLPQQT